MQFSKLHSYLLAATLLATLPAALCAQTTGLGGGSVYVGPAVGLPDVDASLEPGAPDPCLQIANACTIAAIAPLTDINAKRVNFTQACAVSSVIAMNTNCVSGRIFLGGPTLTIPLFETAAASGGYPPVGSLVLGDQNGAGMEGLGRGTNGHNTLLQACTGANSPAVGCVAPATRSFSISSTTVTIAGGRAYLGIIATGMDLQAGEQIRIDASTGAIDNNGAFRVCTPTGGNPSKVNQDANCPAAPTSTLVYLVGGPTYAIASITGNGTTAVATLTCPGSGLSCVPFINTQVMNFTGITNAGFNNSQVALTAVTNAAGTATVSYLNATNASSSGGFVTSSTPCAASCGTIFGGIPLLELGTGSTTNTNFGVAFRNFSINCNSVPSCVNFRNLTGQERVIVDNMSFRNSVERKVDVHTINAQNAGPLTNLELLATAGSTCAVGSTGFFFGDDGPRGLRGNITNNFAGCQAGMTPIAGGYIDASNYAMKVDLGHTENVQFGWICGQGSPCRGVEFDSWAGVANNCLVANCATASGPYAGNASANVLISNSYSSGTPSTSQYLLTNMQKQASTINIEDLITGNASSDIMISSWMLDTNGGSQFFSTSDPSIGGSGSPVTTAGTQTLSNKTLVSPNVSVINDANGKPFVQSTATANAVDGITVTPAATANPAVVAIGASGTDTNIGLGLGVKGTGTVQIPNGSLANPTLCMLINLATCFWGKSSGFPFVLSNGTNNLIAFGNTGANALTQSSGGVVGWTSSLDATATKDTGASRDAPAIQDFGNGAAGDTSGFFKSGMTRRVAADFTTAANTSLQLITGLSWGLPNLGTHTFSFECNLTYSQATAAAAVAFGFSLTANPTNFNAGGQEGTSLTALTTGTVRNVTALTTGTAIVSATPSAVGALGTAADMFEVKLHGTLENPASTAQTLGIMVSTATSADAVSVYRGGECHFTP